MLRSVIIIYLCVSGVIHLFGQDLVLADSHCTKESCPASVEDLASSSEQISAEDGQTLPPGLQECLGYLLCSQHHIKVLREAGQSVYSLDLLTLSRPATLDPLCESVRAMKECEGLHWKEACDSETGSRGRKYDTQFMEWICNKRSRLERYTECWQHPGFTPRLAKCVNEYSDIDDVIPCFEYELDPEDECSDGAIAFVQTMAKKYMANTQQSNP